ncbi:MAG: TonB-dependent receptor [Gemmatimonadales bacterium]
MRRPLVAFVVAALFTRPGSAGAQQTGIVSGTVRDSGGRAIPAAQVTVDGTSLGAVADPRGQFRIPGVPGGPVTIIARAVCYHPLSQPVELPAGDSLSLDLVLARAWGLHCDQGQINPVALSPVVVSAAKRSQLLEEAVTSVALIDSTDLDRRAVNTVDEAVDKAPGVQFLNGQVNIRGSTGYVQGLGSRVLLLVDGVPANQGDRGGINWDLVPVDQVERVEVVKGAGSALYGSAALGGVVNLITRELPLGFHARVRATGGAYADPPHAEWRFRDQTGLHGGLDIGASYGSETLRGRVAAGARHSDGYREQDERDHWQVASKGEWHASPITRVDLAGAWAVDRYQVPLLWCIRTACDDAGQEYQPFKVDASARGARTDSRKGYLAATVSRTPSERLAWQGRGSWIRTHFTDYQQGDDDYAVANRLGAELRVESHPAAERVVTVGAEAALADVVSNIFGMHTQGEYAAYGESERHVGAARLTGGARIDFLAVDGGGLSAVVSPRIGAVLLATGGGTWRASVGHGFRAPSLAERFVRTRVEPFEVIPNPDLRPEKAWSFELGHTRELAMGLARVDAALFWTEARQLIEPHIEPAVLQIQFRNVTRARLAGLDLAITASPGTPKLVTSLGYTLLQARALAHDGLPERPLAFRPHHLLTLGADYTSGPVTVGGDYRYMSRLERVEIFPDDPRVAASIIDVRAGYTRGPITTRVQIANALNYIHNLVPRTLAPVRTISVVATWTY